jgi:peptidoglycan/xylan/chitin deacetylase (PgdA/CDA1 family)
VTTRVWCLAVWCALGVRIPPHDRQVAITIDDLPYATVGDRPTDASDRRRADSVNRAIVAELARRHVPATGFVNQARAEGLGDTTGERILKVWIDAGLDLGNHTYSHPDLNQLSVAQFEDEIVRGETAIRPLMEHAHKPLRFFRFPFNHTGDTKDKHDRIAAFLSRRGYRVATCTIENDDWVFNTAYVHADSTSAARVRTQYLAYTAAKIAYFASLSRHVLGYEPPQVMLLHANDLNAAVIDSVLTLFEREHFRFVSLDAAQADPAYQIPDTVITMDGPMWGYRWARARHITVNGALEPDVQGVIPSSR